MESISPHISREWSLVWNDWPFLCWSWQK